MLANEDLHAENVLRSTREPWLVIDPKPIAAEREFTPVAMIRDRKEEVVAGLSRYAASPPTRPPASDLELDRERVRGWTIAHTLAWGFEPSPGIPSAHAEVARLLLTPRPTDTDPAAA